MSYQAISLQDIYGMLESDNANSLPTLQTLYQQISEALLAAMTRFEHFDIERPTGHTYYLDSFLQEFATMDALAGLRLRVTQDHDDNSHVITGDACSIDTNGCLQLREDNGKISALFTGRIDVIHEA
jgi:BirA family biotin operon repressor/biotin-[acetyl-CoA-carboxylase] ligase